MESVAAPPRESPATGPPPTAGPAMDIVVPPPAEPKTKPIEKPAGSPPAASVRLPGSNVTAAIIATVIIVLGLALLAVFAYLKTKK